MQDLGPRSGGNGMMSRGSGERFGDALKRGSGEK